MKRILLESAYVLHRRSYRETSLLVELFTLNHGRFTVIAKGVRHVRSNKLALLQPFIPLEISCGGKGELMTLSHVEERGAIRFLSGDKLFAGFYLNELLMYLLQKWDAHATLYAAYEKAMIGLQADILDQKILRSFEKCLLEELGYGPLPKASHSLVNTFLPDQYYQFTFENGFVMNEINHSSKEKPYIFSGKSLLAIAKEDWKEAACLQDAKRLMRLLIAPLLGSRVIHSRRLFMPLEEEK